MAPEGPFPPHLRGYNQRRTELSADGADLNYLEVFSDDSHISAQPESFYAQEAMAEDGSEFAEGATAQNNYRHPRVMVCTHCEARVLETKTGDHVCGS